MSFRDAKANEAESSTASSSPIDTSTSRCGRNQSALGFWKSDHSLAVGSLAEVTFNTSNVGSHSVIHNVYGDHIVHPLSCCCTLGGEDGREAAAMLPLKHHRRREPLIESLEPPEIDAYYAHHPTASLRHSGTSRTRPERTPLFYLTMLLHVVLAAYFGSRAAIETFPSIKARFGTQNQRSDPGLYSWVSGKFART
ncbi:hypothetical protein FIBSPDRAFT_958175 [Athelia psychrophila]|uniref:Uncharacterized protein n=1 Tax=Athelia psychrophila TaxID=1759441 RepID=A0A166F0D9_9AGAM|nr:hypothetical protein FIBSPDRAFT_958175 [Fibularhizoctonia sp. CBS 109695]